MTDLYYQNLVPPQEFQRRRSQLVSQVQNGTILLQGGASTEAFDRSRQYNDFFYLTGVETPHAYLTIDTSTGRSILYLQPTDPKLAASEGAELSSTYAEESRELTGCDEVKDLVALDADLANAAVIWCPYDPQEGRQSCQDTLQQRSEMWHRDPWRVPQQRLVNTIAQKWPSAVVHDVSPILRKLRSRKSELELNLMTHAGRLTALAVAEAMRSTEPGIVEGQLQAVADYVFHVNGAMSGGYRPIIASGENIWNIHYYRNNKRMQSGDLVLMDYAPDYAYYVSDIGRMWPVNGKYSSWQRELYGVVVDYHLAVLDAMAPGLSPDEIRDKAAASLSTIINRTHWSRPSFESAIQELLHTSNPFTHEVGMAVHEGGGYQTDVLEPGLVFALDPQLWVREERLYVRVEDTIAITSTGIRNLTADCPHDLDVVEALMNEPGLLQARPDLQVNQ